MGDKVKSTGVSVWTTVLCEIYVSLIVHLYLSVSLLVVARVPAIMCK